MAEPNSPTTTVENLKRRGRRAADLVGNSLPTTYQRAMAGLLVIQWTTLPAAAQSQAAQAGDMMCGTGLGQLLGLGLGLAALGLFTISMFRFVGAWNNMGSARSDKKQEGREQMKGAGLTFAGGFAPGVFGVLLDKAGIGAFSCIDWTNIVGMAVIAPF